MSINEKLKEQVKSRYSAIARSTSSSCCSEESACGCEPWTDVMAEKYDTRAGYNPDADLALGCGIPVDDALLKPGQHVLDLGSGAGNDLFVAHSIVGKTGRLTGLDFSADMIAKAEANRIKTGIENMEFVQGDIEAIPLPDNHFDVVLSNCVMNLVPDKQKAYAEVFRVLRPGGHFTMSDIVIEGEMNPVLQKSAELYVGCVAGAMQKSEYLEIIKNAGFTNLTLTKEREISVPGEWIRQQFGRIVPVGNARILSITLRGFKPERV